MFPAAQAETKETQIRLDFPGLEALQKSEAKHSPASPPLWRSNGDKKGETI
jgi:hypothetical protein